jgi:tRNA modification GTPase
MLRNNLSLNETIFALSSGRLPSAVAILRISGPQAFSIARQVFQPPLERVRGMQVGTFQNPSGQPLDRGLALTFVSPNSHSGDDTVEFHCHGSIAIVAALEKALLECGARPAERGEFSYRAVLNGKMSPGELETLGDVFLARDEVDLRRIYSRLDGLLERQIEKLRSDVIKVQAILDTAVDFSDEYSHVVEMARVSIQPALDDCSAIIQRYSRFRDATQTPRIVLAGKPNAGKSSLFNALLCRYRAIVHEEPGTTRDVIEEDIEVAGFRWKLVDTAGMRDTTETHAIAEKIGMGLGEDFLAGCAFWILVVDGSQVWSECEAKLLDQFGLRPHLIVWNKRDQEGWKSPPGELRAFSVSALTGEGLSDLWQGLRLALLESGGQDISPLPSARQCSTLELVLRDLEDLKGELDLKTPPEFVAEKSRTILNRLAGVCGEVGTEEILDRVFNEFCIGK